LCRDSVRASVDGSVCHTGELDVAVGDRADAVGGDPTKATDRVAKITYPDGTYEQVTYDRLDPEWTRDRLGRWSRKFYDVLRHVVAT
jgi:hypothetical protein